MIGRKLSPSLFLSFACSFFLSFVLFFLYRLYNRNVLAATTIKDTEETDGRTDGLRSEAAAWRTEGTERERGRAGGHCTASEFTGSPQRESSTDGRAGERANSEFEKSDKRTRIDRRTDGGGRKTGRRDRARARSAGAGSEDAAFPCGLRYFLPSFLLRLLESPTAARQSCYEVRRPEKAGKGLASRARPPTIADTSAASLLA